MEVEFYSTPAGDEVVGEFLSSLPDKDLAKALRGIKLLKQMGLELREPNVKHLEGPIWELRIKFSSNAYRILYVVCDENTVVLLHGFMKKTQKTPRTEIAIAKSRWAELEKRRSQEDR